MITAPRNITDSGFTKISSMAERLRQPPQALTSFQVTNVSRGEGGPVRPILAGAHEVNHLCGCLLRSDRAGSVRVDGPAQSVRPVREALDRG